MVRAICSDKKGIYIDLYNAIEADNKNDKNIQRQRKGIYVNLYRQLKEETAISFKRKKEKKRWSLLIIFNKGINQVLSKASYFFSSVTRGFKVLIFTCMVVRRPIKNYIENKSPVYQTHEN